MTVNLGFYNTSSTRTHVRFQFSTHASAGGNVAPLSAFEAADLRIYRAADGAAFSNLQRSSSNGVTMTSPFDSLTGYHDVDIDLTDNSDAGFYASGYLYLVALAPDTETIDGQTITGIPLAYFEIGVQTVNVTQISGSAVSTSTAQLGVNVVNLGGSTVDASSGLINANVKQISTDATAADNAESFFDGTGYAGTGNTIPTVTSVTNRVTANTDQIEGSDATNQIRDSVLSDATRFAGANIATIKSKTDNLPASPAAVGSAMTLTAGTIDDIVAAIIADAATTTELAQAVMTLDVGDVEAATAIHSLCSAVLKLVSKFDALTGTTYRTDGSTTHMTQTPTTNSSMTPIQSLGVAS